MQQAIRDAATGAIVILGIAPDRPETGYGYIKTSLLSEGAVSQSPEQCSDSGSIQRRAIR